MRPFQDQALVLHHSSGFLLKEFEGAGICILAVLSKEPGKHNLPGGRNRSYPDEAPLSTLKRKFKEETGIEIVEVSKPFYTEKDTGFEKRFYLIKAFRKAPAYGEFGSGRLKPFWLSLREFWKNEKTVLLGSERIAFEKLVLDILAKDDGFRKEYQDLIKDILGIAPGKSIGGTWEDYQKVLHGDDLIERKDARRKSLKERFLMPLIRMMI